MDIIKPTLIAAMVVAMAGLIACTDNHRDEKKSGAPTVAAAGQAQAQQRPEEKEADEEESPAQPAAAAAERSAPLQASGQQMTYTFDSDSVGQLPAKFHSARLSGFSADEPALQCHLVNAEHL